MSLQNLTDERIGGAGWNRALHRDHRVIPAIDHGRADGRCGNTQSPQISLAIQVWRADTNQNDRRAMARGYGFRCGIQPSLSHAIPHQFGQTRFKNRANSGGQGFNTAAIRIGKGHMMTSIRQARARHDPHIASAEHGHTHPILPTLHNIRKDGGEPVDTKQIKRTANPAIGRGAELSANCRLFISRNASLNPNFIGQPYFIG